ncbi:MAG: hypothetical protein ACR2RV_02180, partial [Verrucomicrobiales bacterium]
EVPGEEVGEWEVSIWSDPDGDGEPDTRLFVETRPSAEVPRTYVRPVITKTGESYPARNLTFDFSSPFEASAGTQYWISAVYLGATLQPTAYWSLGAPSSSPLQQMSWAKIYPPGNGFRTVEQNGDDESNFPWATAVMSLFTLPANDDDQDGMDDAWETAHQLDPAIDDSNADPDDDDSTNLEEFALRSDPQNPDTDGDGLQDGVESNSGTYMDATDTGTSPILRDSDRDGLDDGVENPSLSSDGPDQHRTDPNMIDSDSDGYGDLLEIQQELNPRDDTEFPALNILGTGTQALLGDDLTDDPRFEPITFDYFPKYPVNDDYLAMVDNGLGGVSDWTFREGDGYDEFPSAYFEVTFGKAITLSYFTLSSWAETTNRDLLAWEIQGSNDGVNFHTIFHRTNEDASIWTARSQVVRFDAGTHFIEPAAYKTFRFATHHYEGAVPSKYSALGELELFGIPFQFEITQIKLIEEGTAAQLEWTSLEGQAYALDRSRDNKTWEEIADSIIGASGGTTRYTDTFEKPSTGFLYRVRVVE